MTNITQAERKVLDAIAHNHFGNCAGDVIWANSINDSGKPSGIEGKALSGVCASLSKKGLLSGDGMTVQITSAGLALCELD